MKEVILKLNAALIVREIRGVWEKFGLARFRFSARLWGELYFLEASTE